MNGSVGLKVTRSVFTPSIRSRGRLITANTQSFWMKAATIPTAMETMEITNRLRSSPRWSMTVMRC